MKRLLLVPMLLIAFPAVAQDARSNAHQSACARDVQRFCRAKMNDGDMVVLGCLKDNRAKLSKACSKVLADNNQ